MNNLRLVRGITIEDRTALGIYRGEELVTMAVATRGELRPGFADRTSLTPEEACWVLEESRSVLSEPWWRATGIHVALALVCVVAFLIGLVWIGVSK